MLKIKNIVPKLTRSLNMKTKSFISSYKFTKYSPYESKFIKKHLNSHLISKNYYLFSNMVDSIKYPSKDSILSYLKESGIEYKIHEHHPIETVPAGLEYFASNNPFETDFTFVKNLFLKNKQGGFILLTAHNTSQVDFKTLCKVLKVKSGNLRQAEKEQLVSYLHVEPGSVTPLALLNLSDAQRSEVQFIFDKSITNEYVGIHPLINTSTILVKVSDLHSLLNKQNIPVNVTDLSVVEEVQTEKTATITSKPTEKKQAEKKTEGQDSDASPLAIQYKKYDNFSHWYSDVIVKSDMIEYYEISGCYILRPWAYQIWETIQKFFDEKIKELGVENAYFPLFVSHRALNKEKEHVAGFSPEVAWVTKSGDSELEQPIAIRPTSETIMYPAFSKWIRSHRDLPLKLNQWTNVVRWEFKNPTPFIRTREFLWQEGHTAHSSLKEADEQVFQILELYRQVYEDLLAVPVVPGRKSENEKFAGGFYTTTVETMITANGKGIQCATSHNLGQNFSKMFEIVYLDDEKQKQYAWQTSWGLTTRSIGVTVMTHGDDHGLVLPPRIAPVQVIIIPIITSKDNKNDIYSVGDDILKQLKQISVRTKMDSSDLHNPGWKYNHWEVKGVPVRIEFGAKDLAKNQVTLFCRDTREKFPVPISELTSTIPKLLETIQRRMFEKASQDMNNKKSLALDFGTFMKFLNEGHMVLTPWCNVQKCEEDVKAKVKEIAANQTDDENNVGTAKTLCIPLNQDAYKEDQKCFYCGAQAKVTVIWGRSY